MTNKAFFNLTHDENGNCYLWIVGTEKPNGNKKPDLTVWAKGYTLERLRSFTEYLKKSSTIFSDFLLIDCKSSKVCKLADYKF